SGVVEDKGRFAKDLVKLIVDCNLPFNIVDNPTFKTFLATWVPAMPVPSRDQLSGPLLMALYANVMREVTQRLTRAQFFALTLDGWSRTQGSEHLLGFCAALPGGSSVFLDVVLTQDHSVTSDFMLAKITQILEKHNLRVLSIPATSAATERLFSAFKFIWSDRRSRLLLGRMWIMSYVFFNTRVMTRKEHHASAEAQEEWESYMAAQVVLDAPQL
ncbi:hypothetical protein QJQ45_021273, partial [Haematococcus lacustris]